MTKVSVIIPAFNEEKYIAKTIQELQTSTFLEIIVVDNGSTDSTARMAKLLGAKVVELPEGSIAAVRNRGVEEAEGDILCFIDSDVRVTRRWHEKLPSVIEKLNKTPLMITGSRYQASEDDCFLNKYWYSQLSGYDAEYINGGNLITTRKLFQLVEGFSEELETAEDYDFCLKAKKAGAAVFDDKELVVIHDGYPQAVTQFIQRERWLGKQDISTWESFLESRIAWIAALNLLLLISALVVSLNGVLFAIPIYFVTMYAVSFFLTVYKFGVSNVHNVIIMPTIYYFYLCGRSLSIVDRIFKS